MLIKVIDKDGGYLRDTHPDTPIVIEYVVQDWDGVGTILRTLDEDEAVQCLKQYREDTGKSKSCCIAKSTHKVVTLVKVDILHN